MPNQPYSSGAINQGSMLHAPDQQATIHLCFCLVVVITFLINWNIQVHIIIIISMIFDYSVFVAKSTMRYWQCFCVDLLMVTRTQSKGCLLLQQ